jgi:hypothetical protein
MAIEKVRFEPDGVALAKHGKRGFQRLALDGSRGRHDGHGIAPAQGMRFTEDWRGRHVAALSTDQGLRCYWRG